MFTRFFRALSTGDLLQSALKQANSMLQISEEMFIAVTDLLLYRKPLLYDIYRQDQEINRMEMEVRKKVLEHLSLYPKQDIVASLTLTTMIVSVERLGDYSKNIYELASLYPESFDGAPCATDLVEQTKKVLSEFGLTTRAIKHELRDDAQTVLVMHRSISQACDQIVGNYAKSGVGNAKEAVMCVLYSRYLKRTSAHLMNIASIALNPFDRIGFYPLKATKAEELESIFGYASGPENEDDE
ncbi:MAG: PhoU domain-containing protein [Candidatus Alcyoniella australis]|nr:PhoU domain-containing protein [Candidatus Alcyoniella australis]